MKITRGQCLKGKNMMMKGVRNKRPFIVTPWSRVMLPAWGPEFDGLRWETCHLHGPHIEQKNKGPDINKPDGDLHSVLSPRSQSQSIHGQFRYWYKTCLGLGGR